MTDEQMERKMEFIVETLARVAVSQERYERNLESGELRLSRLERIAKLMVRAGRRERRVRSEADQKLTINMSDLASAMVRLAEAQRRTEESIAHTDKRLDALIDIVRRQQNGRSSH
jgi:hypothetical protein